MKFTTEQLRFLIHDLLHWCNDDDFRKQNDIEIPDYLHTSFIEIDNNKLLINLGQSKNTGSPMIDGMTIMRPFFADNKYLITIEKVDENHFLNNQIHSWK